MHSDQYFLTQDILKFQGSSNEDPFNSGNVTMSGNGYLGYRGAWPDWRKDKFPACVVTDTFDNADGKWKELCTVPNALFLEIQLPDKRSKLGTATSEQHEHLLNFRYGITCGKAAYSDRAHGCISIDWERFASYEDLHLVAQKLEIVSERGGDFDVTTGIDTDVWSLNGNHFSEVVVGKDDTGLISTMKTTEKKLGIVVRQGQSGLSTQNDCKSDYPGCYQKSRIRLEAGQKYTIELFMSVSSENDDVNPTEATRASIEEAIQVGYNQLLKKHKAAWDVKWENCQVKIAGDDQADSLLRYNMYHNIISTPAHTDNHPIGARGLSCQAYQGAAFWDQEIYNLPMFLFTQPEVARNILIYRHKTLAGAKAKARKYGYAGAYYAWISGDTGEELCPDYFFIDVISKRKIRNHFNDWQIHISPDISYAIVKYFEITGDLSFILDYGAEMLLEIGHFLHSRVHFKPYKDQYELIRVLGPDEYHENADNNVFTNVQAKFALTKALEICELVKKESAETFDHLLTKTGVTENMLLKWKEISDKMYIKQPDAQSLLIEQFDGYFDLEDITPQALSSRLLDQSEYWGWPNGIAFETQVTKQADIVQLFVLHEYPEEVMRANYEYYEPRTQHRSSLSPGVHAIIAAQIGKMDEAYKYFLKSCMVDIANTHPPSSGGTFIGGMHTAACGIAWQILVIGFAGMKFSNGKLSFNPHLPDQWDSIEFTICIKSTPITVSIDKKQTMVSASKTGSSKIAVSCYKKEKLLNGTEQLVFSRP